MFNRKKIVDTDLRYLDDIIDQRKAEEDATRIEKLKTRAQQDLCREAECDRELPMLRLALQASIEFTSETETAFKKARADEEHKRTALWNSTFEYERRRAKSAADRAKLTPEIVRTFRAEMLVEEEHTHRKFRLQERREKPNWFTGKQRIIVETNDQAVEARVAAIRAAIRETESLEFLLRPEAEMVVRMDELRASLPEIKEREVRLDPPDIRNLQTAGA